VVAVSLDTGDIVLQRKEDTIVFNTFVWLQIFNLFNCRAVHDEWNILEGFKDSYITHLILSIIVVLQFAMVQVGGDIMQTSPLTWDEWRACVALGALSIPVGYVLKLFPVFGRELTSMKDAEDLAETVSAAAKGGASAGGADGSGARPRRSARAAAASAAAAANAGAGSSSSKPSSGGKGAAAEATPPSSSSSTKRRGGAGGRTAE
jgi:hypothetical protein